LRDQRPTTQPKPGAARPGSNGADTLGGAAPAGRPVPQDRSRAVFDAAQVPEKLTAAHGKALEGALAELGALAKLGDGLEPWRKKQLERTLGQVYKVLGLQLSLAPEAARADVAKASLAALHTLATETGLNELLMPAMFAATGLVDSSARLVAQKKLAHTPEQAKQTTLEATRTVAELRAKLAGRTGVAAALNVYPNLVEQLERAAGALTPERHRALWREAAALVDAVVPKRGFDQAAAAHVAELVARALAAGAKPADAIAQTITAIREAQAPLHAQARAQLAVDPGNLPAGSAGRATYDHVVTALASVLDANPLGSDALYAAIEAFRARAPQYLVHQQQTYDQAWGCAAAIVKRAAASPAMPELLNQLSQLVSQAAGRAGPAAHLQAAVDAEDHGAMLRALFEAQLELYGRNAGQLPGLDALFESITTLPFDRALSATLVLMAANLSPEPLMALGRGLVELAKTTEPDDPQLVLTSYGARFGAYARRFQDYLGYGAAAQHIPALAARFARATSGSTVPQPSIDAAVNLVRSVVNNLPRAELAALTERASDDRPGLVAILDPAIRYRHPLTNFADALLGQARRTVQHQDAEAQAAAGHLALALTAKLGNLDGEYQLPFQRIQQDFGNSLANPENLRFAARAQDNLGVRAQQKPTVEGFLTAHPELPLELAFTAGLHLSPEQLTWLCDRVAAAHGRDTVRSLRDFVFACVTGNRLDVLEKIRTSPAPAKAISAAITEIGREYRANHLANIPWDVVAEGLGAGRDVMAELREQKLAAGLAGLDVAALAEGRPDPAGLEMIAKCGPAITSCLAYYEEQKARYPQTDAQIDYAPIIPAFKEVLKSVAQGTWPKVKYENDVGKRLLAILTPEQQQLWREENVTALGAAARDDAPLREATTLLRGLVKALPAEVKLATRDLADLGPITFDAASAAKLTAERDALLANLRNTEKGSPEHRALGGRLGAVSKNLAVIELHQALTAHFAGGAVDPKSTLVALAPALAAAESALRSLGAKGSAHAVTEARYAAQDLKASPRQGRYAVDEDSLEALITSHTQASGSCLNYVSGFRRWGLAGSAADANIRMLRTYDGDRFGYRAFLKLFPVKFEGYEGPALWIDSPMREGNGQPEDLQLLYRCAIEKARKLGVPVLGPREELTKEGQALGLPTKSTDVDFSIDEGNTGAQHSDYLFGGAGNVRQRRGQAERWELKKRAQIVLPERN
ncbi:hypothetical protein L6R52_00850, partial [Myxococcota bacterium]|nr:hypothetical protein [Myxococcota bacterium]